MNVSQMKNIIVLKDLPSNLVDEAIVILKKGNKIKNREVVDKRETKSNFEGDTNNNYEIAIKEAEILVGDYISKLEGTNNKIYKGNKINMQYQKLKLCTIFFAITTILGIAISILT